MVNKLVEFHGARPAEVAIVGQAPRQWADYGDNAEVWVVNGPDFPPCWDVLWQLHGWEHIRRRHQKDTDLWLELRAAGGDHRVFMPPATLEEGQRLYAPDAEGYPIDDLVELAGGYLTGSIPIMVAHAVALGVDKITLDGMRFIPSATDWFEGGEGWMIPCTEYHIGRARASGVTVETNHGSGLFRGSEWLYGFTGPGSI